MQIICNMQKVRIAKFKGKIKKFKSDLQDSEKKVGFAMHKCQGSVVCVMCSRLLCPYFFLFCSCVLSLAASESAGREPSCPPITGDIPSPPAGSLVPGVPLPQARRPASDSMPAGSPLTQARRMAADSCLPAAANPSPVDPVHTSRPGEPCLCLVVPTGTFLI